jgi:uncharacterized damage-inducible protein DinB
MGMTDAFIREHDQEAATTRRVLERVPVDKLAWKPHARSMSLGALALHVAQIPGFISGWALKDVFEFTGPPPEPQPAAAAEILAAHEASCARFKEVMTQLGDAGLQGMWEGRAGGKTIFAMPKAALIRTIAMNHWMHHRGQLSVYLRLLDVPVPSIYGPSADENPFRD